MFDAIYGTPRAPLENAVSGGSDILLDIDIQGARQIRQNYPNDTVAIFVLPPSFAELEGRLRGRGTETEDSIQRRLKRAREEARECLRIRLSDHQHRNQPFGWRAVRDRQR